MDMYTFGALVHEVNRVYCEAIGEISQPEWSRAPQWQVESALRGIQFLIENPQAGPDASHLSWMKQKLADGWVYGPKKNPDAKEHPCLVPYHQLPREQKVKDYLFCAVVRTVLKYQGVSVPKIPNKPGWFNDRTSWQARCVALGLQGPFEMAQRSVQYVKDGGTAAIWNIKENLGVVLDDIP